MMHVESQAKRIRPDDDGVSDTDSDADNDDDDLILVHFVETKVYRSGHVEFNSGRRFFKRQGDHDDTHWSDLQTMSREYLNYRLVWDIEHHGFAIRCDEFDEDEDPSTVKLHQLTLIKI